MNYKHILFDLDGTLINPEKGIHDSYSFAIDKMKLNIKLDVLNRKLIGPPLHDGFTNVLELTDEEADIAVGFYRDYYGRKGLYESRLYEGIYQLITDLHDSGVQIYLATSKLEKFAVEILKYLEIHRFFRGISGAVYKGVGADKKHLIEALLNDIPEDEKSKVLMIGDTKYDILGANEAGINSFGVLYGYGSKDELLQSGANKIINDIPHLRAELLK